MAAWQASRSGLEDRLLHPLTMQPERASDVVSALLRHVSDALADSGDLDMVEEALRSLSERGTGAQRQHELLRRTGSLRATVAECARRTCG